MYSYETLYNADPDLALAIQGEIDRQHSHLELIASENFTSKAVMAAVGSPLTNKYAEGYPGKRYYGGCQHVDVVEQIAIDRAKELFGCTYANVQPHSGAQANLAVEYAVLQPGDTFLGMNLDHGGHLSHGSKVNISGAYFNVAAYGVEEDGFIDYDNVLKAAKEAKPKLIICGASAYPRAIDFKKFREIADEVGAYLMADIAHIAGLVVGGEHMSSIPYAHITTTTTHKTLRGPRGGLILASEEMSKELKLNRAVFPGIQGGPLEHVIAGKAVCFKEALQPEFKEYAHQIVLNAAALAQGLMDRGFKLFSNGTDNHLMLVDLRETGMNGLEAQEALEAVGITCNKNAFPGDTMPKSVTGGLRLGSAATTTRGLKEEDMDGIAEAIKLVVMDKNEAATAEAKKIVDTLTQKYPLYAD